MYLGFLERLVTRLISKEADDMKNEMSMGPTEADQFSIGSLLELPPYLNETPAGWAEHALTDLSKFMSDHAWCERKASGNCLSLLAAHLDHPSIAEPMVRLAREEMEHFHLVFNHMVQRGFRLQEETKDQYVRALRTFVRNDRFQLMDRILVTAMIESRSCERLGLIANFLPTLYPLDGDLAEFYRRLTKAEGRHFIEFLEIAARLFGESQVAGRWTELLEFESKQMPNIRWSHGVH
jgi:tRNA-(ms[2]io[6]A)-hydroxylase